MAALSASAPGLVLDAVLLPSRPVAMRCVQLSRDLGSHGTDFVLDEDSVVPHLSMYMGRFEPEAVPAAVRALRELARTAAVDLTAHDYLADLDSGMFEIAYADSAELADLQGRIIAGLNPLRRGLRVLDPVGRRLDDPHPARPAEVRANLDRYGYEEVGSHFRPHVTVTRFRQRDLRPRTGSLPPPAQFSGVFPRLGLFEMGPHGTCTRCVTTVRMATPAAGSTARP